MNSILPSDNHGHYVQCTAGLTVPKMSFCITAIQATVRRVTGPLPYSDPSRFASDSLTAFARANPDRVALVPGSGVTRARAEDAGHAVIIAGGGSGHFPAFAGWVGAGLVDAAVAGNVFASPSRQQITQLVRATVGDQGAILLPINYSGDILNFSMSRDELLQAGVDVRLVPIADDIASGPAEDPGSRRGIAGSFIVMKIVGAAAQRGSSLDELERIARAACRATRTFGVAFSGCTLPGSTSPLFEVPSGRMAVGLGIHGEPGISEVERGTIADVADTLVDGLFSERPPLSGQSVAVLVNGLGGTKYDELHLIFARVAERMERAGMRAVAPVTGELMTSLDMAGLSLSLCYLDDELEDLWRDPADSTAFSRGRVEQDGLRVAAGETRLVDDDRPLASASEASQQDARRILAAAAAALAAIEEEKAHLGDIDAVAGDGDHGEGMSIGLHAAYSAAADAVAAGAGARSTLSRMGQEWSALAGGTSGALWGAGLVAAAAELSDDQPATAARMAAAVAAFAAEVRALGHAEVGDKTMVDAIAPFAAEFDVSTRRDLAAADAWARAAQAATIAAADTAKVAARRGRSRTHGERSIGTPDAGAISFALIVRSAVEPGAGEAD